MRKKPAYIVYDENELPIVVGDIDECRKRINMTHGSFLSLVTNTKKNKNKKYQAYRIEEDI